jgi:DNA-binding LytR/AlgR family response regulator
MPMGKNFHRMTLSELIGNLDPLHLNSIHRFVAINLERIQQLEPLAYGDFEVVLRNGSRCRVRRCDEFLHEDHARLLIRPFRGVGQK